MRTGKGHEQQHRPGAARAAKKPAFDLERAWKARRAAERREKEELKKRRVAEQEERRKRNLQLEEVISGSTLNRKGADVPRYLEHMEIGRASCTERARIRGQDDNVRKHRSDNNEHAYTTAE